jgi:hypothetical protein
MERLIKRLFYYLRDTISLIDIGFPVLYEGHTISGVYFRGEAKALIINNFYKLILKKELIHQLNEGISELFVEKRKNQ